jgi:FAD/FMN-containing dehydrogenase
MPTPMPAPVTPEFEAALRGQLPAATFRDLAPRYAEEPRGLMHGTPGLVLAPATTDEVATIIGAAGAAGVAVIPYSGGTGLVGGQVAPDLAAPLVLSLERMAKIGHVDAQSAVMEVEAGAILQDVQAAADAAGMLFPLTLASQGSARIGGLLSTNAGGVNVIRYGNARDLCLGVEAVLPDGTVYRGLTALRKNNVGYDLRNLLIGAEGSLGVITAASLKLMARPDDQAAALFVVDSPAAALELLAVARARVGEVLSAFELINGTGLEFLTETGIAARQPFADKPDWMCLVDLGVMGAQGTAADALTGLFEAAYAAGLASDGVISQSEGQRRDFWTLREMIPEANKRIGSVSSHDIAVPVARIPDFIDEAPRRLARIGNFRINSFGHMGDGNLHYNVFPPKGRSRDDYAEQRADVRRCVYDLVHEMAGSISAEHGIGRVKLDEQDRYGDPGLLDAMRAIKAALDPGGIMNPGAALRL